MTTAVLIGRPRTLSAASSATKALDLSVRVWFLTAVAGQLVFAFAVASFYASAALRGHFLAWNRFMTQGYIPGDHAGNGAAVLHVAAAVLITLMGAVQLVPQVRRRAPAFHRWTGRVYVLLAVATSFAGLYLMWFRSSIANGWITAGNHLDAALIIGFAAMALRTAMRRDFSTHRRWALRLFMVVSASWLFRVLFAFTLLVFRGPFGFDPATNRGPMITFLSFAQTLLPLAVLELYLRAQERPSATGRFSMAAGLGALTLAMGVGIVAATLIFWAPKLQAAYPSRTSIGDTLMDTVQAQGAGAAVRQYHDLRAADPGAYNFAEGQLNDLGYQLLRAKKVGDAIRILQLNTEAFPQSANVFDSLGEAYVAAGSTSEAIASYRRCLELKPDSPGAVLALQRLGAAR